MNLKYQIMQQDDMQSCATLFKESFQQEPWNEAWTTEQSLERLKEIMSSPHAFGYVVYDESHIIGMLCGRIMTFMDFKELWVDDLCISHHYQGQGIGSLFLEKVKKEMRKRNVSRITLNTTKGFLSEKFYKKNGFEEAETIVSMYSHL